MDTTGAFPRLETERLLLRMLTRDDVDAMLPHFTHEEVTRYADYEPARSAEDVAGIVDW